MSTTAAVGLPNPPPADPAAVSAQPRRPPGAFGVPLQH